MSHQRGHYVCLSVHSSVCPLKSRSQDNLKLIQASLIKHGMRADGNVLIMHVIFLFCRHVKIVVAMVA